ncbi:toxic anion resistance protein [Bacillus pumilus]|uniref:Toxic anion resistance protein TelA n=1 Tax=Bacillus pumilus TaxID=1408 RepID=A0AAD0HJS1_BACPU|nr:toxic anion resistance protein [Bacillus pumilus]AVM22368.1 toxic anion resistance protein TelA [Bacillus pumilus]TYS39591.1 toxic anion resistance protein TelA [Bacillus pumilus]
MKPEDHVIPSTASTTDLQFRVFDTLSDEEKQKAVQRAKQIPDNPQKLLFYGTRVQERLLEQSQQMMKYVEKKDIDQIGDVLEAFLQQLDVVEPEDLLPKKQGFFLKLFQRNKRSTQEILSRFQHAKSQIERLSARLRYARGVLISDHMLLERLFEENQTYFQEMTMQVAAVEAKMTTLEQKETQHSGHQTIEEQLMSQEVNEDEYVERLKERKYDLLLSRQIALQCNAQIRMIQHTNHTLANHIQSTVSASIPLWINQMSIALTHIQQRANSALEKRIQKTYENVSKQQGQILEEASLAPIDKLKMVQRQLAETLQETLQVKEHGSQERAQLKSSMYEAEQQLANQPIKE